MLGLLVTSKVADVTVRKTKNGRPAVGEGLEILFHARVGGIGVGNRTFAYSRREASQEQGFLSLCFAEFSASRTVPDNTIHAP